MPSTRCGRGLAIVDAAPKLETAAGAPLHVRVGIATGIVVVGDLLGSGEAQERGVVGDTPNLAARLQGIAEPDSVVIAEGTRKLLGNLFELRGSRARTSRASPDRRGPGRRCGRVRSREPLRGAARERADARSSGGKKKANCCSGAGRKAKAGEGQVVLLSGEAGIGKSRLDGRADGTPC